MILSTFCFQNKTLTLSYYDEKYNTKKYGIILHDNNLNVEKVSYRNDLRTASLRYAEMIIEMVL